MRSLAILASLLILLLPGLVFAWGDEGHEVIALIAWRYLTPRTRAEVTALLAQDASQLTPTTDIAAEATWADKFRVRNPQTREWHFVNLEIEGPDEDTACFHHPPLPRGVAASAGPAHDCIIDKIGQFRRELHDTSASPAERLLALQFLLHLVGDLHQPLHAADNHDRGGNDVAVQAGSNALGNLHQYWDTVVVEQLGIDARALAARLTTRISARQRRRMSLGSPTDWAMQSFDIATSAVYGQLPAVSAPGEQLQLNDAYRTRAAMIAEVQLQRAGIRLARVLNEALRTRASP
jgi:S1/P1 Nuclease